MIKLREKFRNWLFEPSTGERLAILRIVLGLAMMLEAAQVFSSLDDLYGPYGFLQTDLMNAVSGRSLPSLAGYFEAHGLDYSRFLHFVYGLRWIFLVTFTLGLATRVSNVALWLAQAAVMSSGALSSYGVDRYFHLLLFLMMWMPTGKAFSLDRILRGDKATKLESSSRMTVCLRVLQIAILLTYFNAGVAKSRGTEWWTGDAIWRSLQLPEFKTFSFYWLADVPWLAQVLGWFTMLLESFYIVGVWIPVVGQLWALAIIGLHVGIASFMGLVSFGITMCLINGALFLKPPSWRTRSASVA